MALEIEAHSKYKGIYTAKDGRVFRVQEFTPFPDQYGYQRIGFHDGKQQRQCGVHRLVMECWSGPSELVVNHIDFDRANNNIENLEYVTYKQNSEHSNKAGRLFSGTQKIDDMKMLTILTYAPHKNTADISALWGMAPGSIRNVATGKTFTAMYKKLFDGEGIKIFAPKNTKSRDVEVIEMLKLEPDFHKVAAKFKIGVSRIKQIALRHKREAA